MLDLRRHKILTALSVLRHKHGHNVHGLLQEIAQMVGGLDEASRQQLLEQLIREIESQEDDTKNIVGRY